MYISTSHVHVGVHSFVSRRFTQNCGRGLPDLEVWSHDAFQDDYQVIQSFTFLCPSLRSRLQPLSLGHVNVFTIPKKGTKFSQNCQVLSKIGAFEDANKLGLFSETKLAGKLPGRISPNGSYPSFHASMQKMIMYGCISDRIVTFHSLFHLLACHSNLRCILL